MNVQWACKFLLKNCHLLGKTLPENLGEGEGGIFFDSRCICVSVSTLILDREICAVICNNNFYLLMVMYVYVLEYLAAKLVLQHKIGF